MVSFLLHSVGFRRGEKSQRSAVLKFRDEYFPYPPNEIATSIRVSDEQLKFVINKIIEILIVHNRNLRTDWANLSLQWAVQSTDIKLAVSSLRLFYILNKEYDNTIIFFPLNFSPILSQF